MAIAAIAIFASLFVFCFINWVQCHKEVKRLKRDYDNLYWIARREIDRILALKRTGE